MYLFGVCNFGAGVKLFGIWNFEVSDVLSVVWNLEQARLFGVRNFQYAIVLVSKLDS